MSAHLPIALADGPTLPFVPPSADLVTLEHPVIGIEMHTDVLRIRFQDPISRRDLVIVNLPRELAGILASEFGSVQP